MEVIKKVFDREEAKNKAFSVVGTLFKDKGKRDEVAKELKGLGYKVKRGNATNQQLHPEYVEDYEGSIETGFGNSMYQMFWRKLYTLKAWR